MVAPYRRRSDRTGTLARVVQAPDDVTGAAPRTPEQPPLPREVYVLAAVAFAVAIGFGIVAPALPLFARHFGVGARAAGAVVSVFAAMRFVSALGSGRLVDRIGERIVLAAGITIVAVSSALAGLSQSYAQLLVLRGIGGVGSAMFTVAAISLLLRVVRPDQRGRASGMWQAGFLIGGMAGPALGGFITDRSLRAPFFIYAGTLVVAGSLGLLFLARTHLRDEEDTGPLAGSGTQRVGQALRNPAYVAALLGNLAVGWTLLGVRFSVVPLYVVDRLHGTASLTGAGLLVSAVAQGAFLLPVGRYADRVGRRPVMILGSSLAGLSMVMLAVVETRPSFFLSMAVYGAGASCLSVAPAAIVGDIAGARRGSLVAAFQMSSDLGAIVGPLVAGQLVDSASYAAAFAVSAGVVLLVLVPATVMRETSIPAAPPPPSRAT